MMKKGRMPGQKSVQAKGWLLANKWLLLRRLSQLGLLALFLLGPLAGIWVVSGTLSASTTLGLLPLADPLAVLQSLAAGHLPAAAAIAGTLIVLAAYAVVGGRTYCAWVCPVNLLTDAAAWLHRRRQPARNLNLGRTTRYWLLGLLILLAAATGSLVWESINPVTALHRGLTFGMGLGWLLLAAIFVFDAFMLRNGWCGHICPVGAFYSLVGFRALLRVRAVRRDLCNDCMDCFAVCPEPQVIRPALKGPDGSPSLILSPNCMNCGRCIDVCPRNVFCFSKRA